MANAVNDDPGRVRPIEDYIWVRIYHKTQQIALVRGPSAGGVVCEQINHALQPSLDALGATRRPGFNVVQNLGHLPERPACVADFHSPCFAHIARTSSSVANSPRSASASEASMSAASSGVSSSGG